MEIKKTIITSLLTLSILTPFLMDINLTLAASANAGSDSYQLLAPIPEFGDSYNVGSFNKYVNIFIKLSITIAAILAVIFIVLGGFKYMTSESLSLKEEGKDNIKNAIVGLILLSASFLILNTINPKILEFKLEIPSVNVKTVPDTNTKLNYGTTGELNEVGDTIRENVQAGQASTEIPIGSACKQALEAEAKSGGKNSSATICGQELENLRSQCTAPVGKTTRFFRSPEKGTYTCTIE